MQGRIQDFKLEGVHLKKLRRAEGGANIFGVFRVKNHDFTPKNQFFSNFVDPPGSSPVMGKTTEEIDGNEYIDLTIYISGLC
jgi:hypothetical protein